MAEGMCARGLAFFSCCPWHPSSFSHFPFFPQHTSSIAREDFRFVGSNLLETTGTRRWHSSSSPFRSLVSAAPPVVVGSFRRLTRPNPPLPFSHEQHVTIAAAAEIPRAHRRHHPRSSLPADLFGAPHPLFPHKPQSRRATHLPLLNQLTTLLLESQA